MTTDLVPRWRVSVSNDDKWTYFDSSGKPRKVSIDGGEAQPAFSPDLLSRLTEPLPRGFHEAMVSPDGTAIAGHYLPDLG